MPDIGKRGSAGDVQKGPVKRIAEAGTERGLPPDLSFEVVGRSAGVRKLDGATAHVGPFAVTLESGERRRITELDAMHPAWSPDGRRIVFWGVDRTTDFRRDLWTAQAQGKSETVRLTDDLALDWDAQWSGDGRWLYFCSTRGGTMNLWRLPMTPAGGGSADRGRPDSSRASGPPLAPGRSPTP